MIKDLNIYREFGKKFEEYLRPSTFPIAIKLIKEESEIPPESRRPNKDLKIQNFICQNFSMVRRYGWTIAIMEEDCVCKLARWVYGWDEISEEMADWGHQFNIGLYSKDLETSKKLESHLFMFNNKYKGLVISPLTRTKVIPDVVQIYCMPAQAMRITQSYLYMEGGMLEFTDAGRIGSCHIGIIKTFQTEKPQLVLLGNGDRVWGGAEDHEVMYSVPKSKLEVIIQGLEATHSAGLRYPIPKYMNYKPGFQSDFRKRALKRAGGTLVKDE
ncbi:MAG: DUF169 domain-containing protein [Candidatus Hermodarchaeota archaeon]